LSSDHELIFILSISHSLISLQICSIRLHSQTYSPSGEKNLLTLQSVTTSLMCPQKAPAEMLSVSSNHMQWDCYSLLCLKKAWKREEKKRQLSMLLQQAENVLCH